MIAEFAEESLSEYGTILDLEQLRKTFEEVYTTSFVAVVDGKLVGVLGGRITFDRCSPLPVFEEVVWYVQKEYRHLGMKLFNYMVDWCREDNIDRISLSCMHNSKTEQLFRIYKKMGFEPMETRFIKQL